MDDTLVIQWTIIGVGGGLAGIVIAGFIAVGWVIKAEVKALRSEIGAVRTESKAELDKLNVKLDASVAELNAKLDANVAELKASIARLDAKLDADVARLEAKQDVNVAELKAAADANASRLNATIAGIQQQIFAIRQMFARFALHRHGEDGLPVAPLTDALDPPEGTGGISGEGDGSGSGDGN